MQPTVPPVMKQKKRDDESDNSNSGAGRVMTTEDGAAINKSEQRRINF